jgi:hypothetical protein
MNILVLFKTACDLIYTTTTTTTTTIKMKIKRRNRLFIFKFFSLFYHCLFVTVVEQNFIEQRICIRPY